MSTRKTKLKTNKLIYLCMSVLFGLALSSERFIEVFVPCQKSKQSGHVYVIGVSSVPLTCSSIGFWTVPCIMPEKWASGHIYIYIW